MKKVLSLPLLALIVLASCKDDVDPDITLSGGNTVEHSLNEPFTDPGFSADDDKDGDITGSVTVTGSVDVDLVGDYPLTYNVEDDAGNSASAVTRTVEVRNDADHLDGIYFVSANQTYGSSTGTPTSVQPGADQFSSSNTLNNRLFLDAFPIYVTYVNETTLEVPVQGPAGDQWSGSGTIDAAGDIILNLNHDNTVGGQSQYELYYSKQ